MTVGTQKILSTGLKQCLGTGPKRTSVVSLPPLFSLQWFNFLLHFSFFSPPLRVLQFIIRLNASPGVSYFSHSFNIFRGRHLFACLFVCLFFYRRSTLLSTPLFDLTWYDNPKHLSTTGSISYYKNETKNTKTKKELVLLDWYRSEPGIMGYLSDRICCWRAVSWVGWVWFLDGWWTFVLVFLACWLACVISWFLDWICLLRCCCLSLWRSCFTFVRDFIVSYLHTLIPFTTCGIIVRYLCILHIISPYHLIWYGMIMDFALSTFLLASN